MWWRSKQRSFWAKLPLIASALALVACSSSPNTASSAKGADTASTSTPSTSITPLSQADVDKALAAPALRQAIIYRAEHKPDAMVSAFRSAAEAGNPVAELQLAELYRQGVDIQQDDDLADSWLQKAAAQGLGEAQVMLAERAFANPDGQQTPAAGWYWLMLAQTQQRPAIWTMIGQLYLAGVLPLSTAQAQSIPDLINDTSRTPDTADALTYFHRAADAGDESGELALCLFYMRGEGGTAPSPGTGKQWCDRAAARGNLEARKYSSTTAQLPTPLPSPDKDGPIVVALEYVGDGAILLVYGAFYLLAQCGGSGFHGF